MLCTSTGVTYCFQARVWPRPGTGSSDVSARLKTELQMVMQLAGTANIKSINEDYISGL
jgi:hypothetical protein